MPSGKCKGAWFLKLQGRFQDLQTWLKRISTARPKRHDLNQNLLMVHDCTCCAYDWGYWISCESCDSWPWFQVPGFTELHDMEHGWMWQHHNFSSEVSSLKTMWKFKPTAGRQMTSWQQQIRNAKRNITKWNISYNLYRIVAPNILSFYWHLILLYFRFNSPGNVV